MAELYEASLNPPPTVPPQNIDVDNLKIDPFVLTDKVTAEAAGYMELAGAKKDGGCKLVTVEGGVSKEHGCCNLFDPTAKADDFRCGECTYLTAKDSKVTLTATTYSTANALFCTMLSSNWPTTPIDGRNLQSIPVVTVGTWHRNGKPFSITLGDLESIVKNFNKRLNGQVVVDYEHASENPSVAKGGPIPAAGWIHNLHLAGNTLYAEVEWTPEAEQQIKSGQYRFFSPAINWLHEDKHDGGIQGTTMTSGALTNHPFLEELAPILMTEATLMDIGSVHVPGPIVIAEGEPADVATIPKIDPATQGTPAPVATEPDKSISVAISQPITSVTDPEATQISAPAPATTSTTEIIASEDSEGKSIVGQAQTPAGTEAMADKPTTVEAADTASVGGEQVNRKDFLYVGDPNQKSTWKLPVHDESHIRNALARYNQAEIPAADKAAVGRKLVALAKKHGIDTSGFEKEHLCEGMNMAIKKIEDGKFAGRYAEFSDDGKVKHLFPKNMTDAEMADYSKEMSEFADAPGMGQPTNPSQNKEAIVTPRGMPITEVAVSGMSDTPAKDVKAEVAAKKDKATKEETPADNDDDEKPAVIQASKKKLSDVEVLSMITSPKGRIMLSEVGRLVESGQIDPAVVFRAQAAEQAVDEAIKAEKFLPKQRGLLLRQALQDPEGFAELVLSQPSLRLSQSNGLASTGEETAGSTLDALTKQLMTDHKGDKNYSYADALSEAVKTQPTLWSEV